MRAGRLAARRRQRRPLWIERRCAWRRGAARGRRRGGVEPPSGEEGPPGAGRAPLGGTLWGLLCCLRRLAAQRGSRAAFRRLGPGVFVTPAALVHHVWSAPSMFLFSVERWRLRGS